MEQGVSFTLHEGDCLAGVGEVCEGCGDGGGAHTLDGLGHDGDGDEVEYDDEDEEPCAQGEGGGMCLFNGRHTSGL